LANDYFTGDRSFWDDPDFKTIQEKAVYAMLWQSLTTDIAGIHIRNDKIDADRVCIGYRQYLDTLSQLQNKKKIKVFPTKIWLKAAIWHNLNKGRYSIKQLKAITNRIPRDCAKEVIEYYKQKYNLTIPIPYPMHTHTNGYSPLCTESESETESETETETGNNIVQFPAETLSNPTDIDDSVLDVKKDSKNSELEADIKRVYDFYIEQSGRKPDHYKLTPLRKQKIRSRLKEGFTLEQMGQAINDVLNTPWNMGENPGGKKYIEIEDHIFRSREQTEKRINDFITRFGEGAS